MRRTSPATTRALTDTEHRALTFISENDGPTPADLATFLGVTQPATYPLLRRLRRIGAPRWTKARREMRRLYAIESPAA